MDSIPIKSNSCSRPVQGRPRVTIPSDSRYTAIIAKRESTSNLLNCYIHSSSVTWVWREQDVRYQAKNTTDHRVGGIIIEESSSSSGLDFQWISHQDA
ncbi:hypothetical protein NPIL_356091 [Nephila pilipes]|uniref:Uncharacterized protein n=1 Tax=Nephila pilipes TaxID=299642 RepID=A0A8X6QMC8_NEPPI|nr:hypothetical protein NPIL_356091 [Nephila pilipes]